ncbi:MAG: methyltransferase domain-containing protein [Candidatus Eisenbacteria bacterium]|uniref:Methyltransferase domain-containing protein n=1 Tax=Eiseniibacteriota bacterium TaxID=2212470 RepID=A0A956SE95_UNCEI|nr:methyltransferase domain-containing protein [Candidatus Eisenbacteria bacterium]MCB9466611.1 methyltransferase domain-containing protein [Candidatus Eisenbacteria bacterium]
MGESPGLQEGGQESDNTIPNVKLDLHYVDPRLVAMYEDANGRGPDTEFFLGLASQVEAETILDLGCGTGLLTRELASKHRRVVGVDPSAAMLDYGKRQPGAERVEWIHGDSRSLPSGADLALMTGNVAQVFLEDEEWNATLANIRAALRPGGHLAFETRNHAARAWEHWNRDATFGTSETPHGPLDEWMDVVSVGQGRVVFEGYNVFRATNETLVIRSELRFRTEAEVRSSLERCGFTVEQVFGDWNSGPVTSQSQVLVFVARR